MNKCLPTMLTLRLQMQIYSYMNPVFNVLLLLGFLHHIRTHTPIFSIFSFLMLQNTALWNIYEINGGGQCCKLKVKCWFILNTFSISPLQKKIIWAFFWIIFMLSPACSAIWRIARKTWPSSHTENIHIHIQNTIAFLWVWSNYNNLTIRPMMWIVWIHNIILYFISFYDCK